MRPYIFKLMDAARDEAARFSAWVKTHGLAADDWITISGRDSNGDKHGGARVLLDDDGAIVYGLGGGHAGKKRGDALTDIKRDAAAQRGQGTLFSDFKSQARKERKQAQAEKKERQRKQREERAAQRKEAAAKQKKQEQKELEQSTKQMNEIIEKKVALLEREIKNHETLIIPSAEKRARLAEYEYNRTKAEYDALKGKRGEKKAAQKFKDAESEHKAAQSYLKQVKADPDKYRLWIKQIRGEV